VFTGWCRALAPDPVLPDPAGSAWADALTAITAAAQALATRFDIGPNFGRTPVWEAAVSVSGGLLLAPGWPRPGRLEWINTSCP
jgi:hypothetical protein